MLTKLMILRWFFNERKIVVINLPFSNKNEDFSKKLFEKLDYYTNGQIK